LRRAFFSAAQQADDERRSLPASRPWSARMLCCAPPGLNRPQANLCRQRRQNGPPQTGSRTQRVSTPRHESQPSRRALGRRAAPTSRQPRFCPQIVPMAWALA
jgi:hypothetical protein